MKNVLFICPRCDTPNEAANPAAHLRLVERGVCQGCRAADTIKRRPELTAILISYWSKHRFPSSPAWLSNVEAAG